MHEPWIERVIREAAETGTFDDVEGAGQPIAGLARTYDPAWWARNWIAADRARERSADLARLIEREVPLALAGNVEQEAKTKLESLNVQIVVNNDSSRHEGNGLPLLDVESLLKEWAIRRSGR